jgi:hypothetical protein
MRAGRLFTEEPMQSIERRLSCLSCRSFAVCLPGTALVAGLLLSACSTVGGDDPLPDPSALTVEHRKDGPPVLAAVDGEGQVFSTYWHGADDLGYRMVVTLQNPSTGERGQLRMAVTEETGETEYSVIGDYGQGTWSDRELPAGSEPPAKLVGDFTPWLDFWRAAAEDEAHAVYLQPPDDGISLQNPLCTGACGVVTSSSCNYISHTGGKILCQLIGVFVCEGFCNHTPSQLACFVTDDGACRWETCCQETFGCHTRPIEGSCPTPE